MMVGISGSGKTTTAHKLAYNTNTVIIGRDKLREMLFGYNESDVFRYYLSRNINPKEECITNYQNYLIQRALTKGQDVIIDNTNLQLRYINKICQKFNKYDIKFHLVECDVEKAILRDKERARRVGENIIRKQYVELESLKQTFDFRPKFAQKLSIFNDIHKEKIFVFDIDGTLALMQNRSPYDYSRVDTDIINEPVAATYKLLSEKYKIIICSGRESTITCRLATELWLKKHNLEYHKLIMRPEGDKRADYIVKEEMWQEICQDYYIVAMYDDRNQVVNHARNLGFSVFQVAEGDF